MSLFRCLTLENLLPLVVLGTGAAACDDPDSTESDGGPNLTADGGQGDESRSLEIVSEGSLQLGFEQTADLELEYLLADGTPASDPVSFAIEGRPGDSSLSEVTAIPSTEGRVVTTLRAGTVGAASFRVRASAPGAANAYIEVSIGDAGFGNLSVVAEYGGSREVWGCELRLYTDRVCGELDPRAPPIADRSVHVGGAMEDGRWPGLFGSLAVGPTYTVLALGLGNGDGVVASGCVPGVAVEADPAPPVEVVVVLEDQPYGAAGRYTLDSQLDLTAAMSGRVDAWLAPATALLAEGTPAFLLDEIGLYLDQNVPEDAAGRFDEQRSELLLGLAERLAARDGDPSAALAAIARDLDASLYGPSLRSELLLDQVVQAEDQVTALRFSHEARELGVSLVVSGGLVGPRTVTFSQAALVSLSSGAATTTTEELALASHTLPFRLGTIAATVLRDALVPELGAASLPDYLAELLDCSDVGDWLAEQADGACDSACYAAACQQAAAHVADAMDQGLRDGDADYDALILEGHARLSDGDGDAATDVLDGGVWTARLTGDLESEVPAEFQGERDDIE
jgi:hypothetical protein